MRNFERLFAVPNVKLGVAFDAALINTKHTHFANKGIVDDFEYVRYYMQFFVRVHLHRYRIAAALFANLAGIFWIYVALTFKKRRRIAFTGIRQQAHQNIE